jgi:anionic cell wall polymer biosynthesis LytR-Cps2A-Psr (LCP) family protein
MRHDDPSGDFGRQSRQRAIIEAVIKEGASLSSLTKYDEVFAALGNNIQTNLTFDDMMDIQKNYRDASKSITQSSINGNGTKIDGIYYYIVSDEEKEKVQSELKEQLSIK